jgi:hypothetical protein
MLNYNDNFGPETKYTEYKEFNFFTCGLKISNEDAIELLTSNKWIFNKEVLKVINSMIKLYLPKYTSAYLSSNMDKDSELYFGIDDTGTVIGIPFQGELDKNKIIKNIKHVFNNNLKYEGNIFDLINIDIIKLNYVENKIKEINPYLSNYYKHCKIRENKKEKYMAIKTTWNKLLDRYTAKLCDLVNNPDTRHELINYIDYYVPGHPLIKLLKSNYTLQQYTMEEIQQLKTNKNNIIYWLTEWKDKMLKFIKLIRPKFNYKIPCQYYPNNIIIFCNPVIPYWIKYNKDINLYVIKFTFKKNQQLKILYKNIYNEWATCIRTIIDNKPCCLSY